MTGLLSPSLTRLDSHFKVRATLKDMGIDPNQLSPGACCHLVLGLILKLGTFMSASTFWAVVKH